MPRYAYERLTALDASFLLLERPNAYMHVASTARYEAGPLRTAQGGIDVERIRRGVAGILHRIPRYRQKLAWIPIERAPVWVDDPEFNLAYHVRHTSLPCPGNDAQLKELAARVMAQRLDRSKPLWELWVVEGLQGDRFAVINKVHHCMIDGISGVDLMNVMMEPTPNTEIPEAPPFVPRPMPSAAELLQGAILRRLRLPLVALRDVKHLLEEVRDTRQDLLVRSRALLEALGGSLRPAPPTPLNQPLGPHRRFDWLDMDLGEVRAVRRRLGGSLNDVVLTIVTGAMRRFLRHRRVETRGLDFRILAPVSVRSERERGTFGNRVSAWIVPLPVGLADPLAQLRRISEKTRELKQSRAAVAAEALTQVADFTPTTLLSLGARTFSRLLPFNLVVTNVPGPQVPLYLLGARMLEVFPQVPITDGTGLGIALMSYDGHLFWGFNADFDAVPDLERVVAHVSEAWQELRSAARSAPGTGRRETPRRSRRGSAPEAARSSPAGKRTRP